jgi:hypothetical protein
VSTGATHRVGGLYAGTALGLAAGWPLWQTAASALIAAGVAHGPTSPDADQSWLAWTGRHRGVTHWPGWPLLLAAFTPAAGPQGWPLYSIAVGVLVGHLVLDAVWGKPGVPLLPCAPWFYVGLGLPVQARRTVRERDWSGELVERKVSVGHVEAAARRVLQWGLVPLGAWAVLAPAILPALLAGSGRAA